MTAIPVTGRPHWLLGGHPSDPALVKDDRTVSYGELAELVDARRSELGDVRRLVALESAPTLDFVVTYLAALGGRHPVLLLAAGDADRHRHLLEEYRPDVVLDAAGLRELRPATAHQLHPDLALLLSTSGSTGSPKLVRLSRTSVLANAGSIAEYLDLRSTDTAITSLPLHYCYGLSVLHSHLLVGAKLVLTRLSVADDCFWEQAARERVTGLVGVPHTFALLDSVDFATRHLPRLPALRYLTQAGGRMEPARVRSYAELGREHGVDFFVMYGQTEATARMAYLPPALAAEHPGKIGVPIPGGSLRIAPVDGVAEPGVGELVYAGPNVMMGYARTSADLAAGPSLAELRTGDLARRSPEGLFEVVGRLDRQAKVLGHRLDLDRVEAVALDAGLAVRLVARPDRLWVFVAGARRRARARSVMSEATGLRGAAIQVVELDRLPVLDSGKPNDAALRQHVTRAEELGAPVAPAGPMTAAEVRDLYAVVLGRPDATVADSFAGLGGDSLSYVEVSTRLGERARELPPAWPSMSAASLAALMGPPAARPGGRRRRVPVDMSVLLRAAAITLVVVTHADLFQLQGGAHVLLAVVGFNLARFQLAVPERRLRVLGLLRSARSVAVPTLCFVGALALLGGTYDWPTALLLNGLMGSDSWNDQWRFWFLETVVWSYVALAGLVALPLAHRALRASPFALWTAVLGVTLAVRYLWVGVEAGATERYTPGVVLWCLALGACAAHASTPARRWLVAVLAVAATAGFFGDLLREAIVAGGVLLLLRSRPVRLPPALATVIGVVAAASLWIYLTHWQVYPGLEAAGFPILAVAASIAVGVGCHLGARRLTHVVRRVQAGAAASAAASRSATTIFRIPSIAWVAAWARAGSGRTSARATGPARSARTARTCRSASRRPTPRHRRR